MKAVVEGLALITNGSTSPCTRVEVSRLGRIERATQKHMVLYFETSESIAGLLERERQGYDEQKSEACSRLHLASRPQCCMTGVHDDTCSRLPHTPGTIKIHSISIQWGPVMKGDENCLLQSAGYVYYSVSPYSANFIKLKTVQGDPLGKVSGNLSGSPANNVTGM